MKRHAVWAPKAWVPSTVNSTSVTPPTVMLSCASPRPLLLATSRKRFIASVDPAHPDADHRLGGSIATALWGVSRGCAMVRCHDVAATVQALHLWTALKDAAMERPT